MTDEPEPFPGRLLLYAINGWEVYPIKASTPLPPKFQWLEGLGDYFLYAKSARAVVAIASRKADGTLESEIVGRKGGGARGRIGGKDFGELIGRVESVAAGELEREQTANSSVDGFIAVFRR